MPPTHRDREAANMGLRESGRPPGAWKEPLAELEKVRMSPLEQLECRAGKQVEFCYKAWPKQEFREIPCQRRVCRP